MKKRLAGLRDFIGQDTVVRVERKRFDEENLDGFVVGMSDVLLLLQPVEGDTLLLNGYSVVRLRDVSSWRVDPTFVTRALRLLGRKPVVPEGIGLSDWPLLLASAQQKYPFLMIETEMKAPGCGFIGRVMKQTTRRIHLEEVDPRGYWAGVTKFACKDITQVGFDDGYTTALAALVAAESDV